MINKVLSGLLLMAVIAPPSYAQPAEDVEACVESKRAQYPGDTLNNMRQRCFPIAATCWGWGAGENAVYEYCGADALRDRGVDSLAKDQDRKSDWE
ncbi:hypothetical protein Y5S_03670 [Alcanivorax nanhaiticus]|uniref:Uncharacterized protein n=1 Tax=Alcanivorax nanhaiticus TaxID=1177154 RepID=A0A095SCE8_9GAMM|nr:hypothetical protein [Alcanivorax nanhaiticus]KGD62182.1 hypothetical protein Y5S_03670 [Alcanivorax nanhaiticus]